MQPIHLIETYAYGKSKYLVSEQEEIKCNNIKKNDKKIITFDHVTKRNIKKHNPHWTQILDHSYRILIIRGSGSGKTNALLNLINHEPDIDKIYLYPKDLYEAKKKYRLKVFK